MIYTVQQKLLGWANRWGFNGCTT